jgi:bifunctional ADP-heptose synthase (sugar kinase/adenylyltransferase)
MKTIVYSYYVGDIVHRGHLLQMMRGKSIAGRDGVHVAGVLTDEAVMERKAQPIISFDERMEIISSIKYVDIAISQDTYSPLPNLYRIQPDIHLESDSHDPNDIKKVKEYMEKIGGRVIVAPYYSGTSSTKIKQKIKEVK